MWVSSIKGSQLFVAVGGFRTNVDHPRALVKAIVDVCAPHAAQIMDASLVAGRDHLFMAAVNAVRSTETGTALSKSVAVETLLYASAQDQITKALTMLGVTTQTTAVALLVFATSQRDAEIAYSKAARLLGEEDDYVLEIDESKQSLIQTIFGIKDAELEAAGGRMALGGLVIERGALLSLHR